jgi:hypothetical protein
MDLDIQTILFNEVPQLLSVLLELFARGDVVEQSCAQKLDILRRKTSVKRISGVRVEKSGKRTQD